MLPIPTSVCGVSVFTWVRQDCKSSATHCYQCMWCFSVYLGVVTYKSQEELYSVILPVHVLCQRLPSCGYCSLKISTTQPYQRMWCFSVYLGTATNCKSWSSTVRSCRYMWCLGVYLDKATHHKSSSIHS